jgi:hypothetical protein
LALPGIGREFVVDALPFRQLKSKTMPLSRNSSFYIEDFENYWKQRISILYTKLYVDYPGKINRIKPLKLKKLRFNVYSAKKEKRQGIEDQLPTVLLGCPTRIRTLFILALLSMFYEETT